MTTTTTAAIKDAILIGLGIVVTVDPGGSTTVTGLERLALQDGADDEAHDLVKDAIAEALGIQKDSVAFKVGTGSAIVLKPWGGST